MRVCEYCLNKYINAETWPDKNSNKKHLTTISFY